MSPKLPYRGLCIIRKSTDGKAARGYSFIHSTFGLLGPHRVPGTVPGAEDTWQSRAGHPPPCPGSLQSSGETDD